MPIRCVPPYGIVDLVIDFSHLQSVTPDSLNRLVACTADDSQIIAICGETKLDNEEGSWWTMIQVRDLPYIFL